MDHEHIFHNILLQQEVDSVLLQPYDGSQGKNVTSRATPVVQTAGVSIGSAYTNAKHSSLVAKTATATGSTLFSSSISALLPLRECHLGPSGRGPSRRPSSDSPESSARRSPRQATRLQVCRVSLNALLR